jgi:hypothetical protein
MFAPDQEQAASELLRVCRPGGKIALACWTPEHFAGDFFRRMAKYVPPPAGVKPPLRWGTEAGVRELLASGASEISSERRTFCQYFLSIEHMVESFRNYFGPTQRAFETIDADGQHALHRDLMEVFARYNRATDGTAAIEGEYLQTIVSRA